MKPKIAIIGAKGLPAFGGSARVVESLISMLHEKYDFTVYAVSSHTDQNGVFEQYSQIVLKKLPHKKLSTLFYYIKATLHCLLIGDYDIVHVHHFDAAFIIPFLKLKYKVISTTHGMAHKATDKWSKLEKKLLLATEWIYLKCPAHILTACAKSNQKIHQKRTHRKIHYIPNAVFSEMGILPPVPHSDYLFFAAGRIIRTKGLHTLLEALHKIDYKGKLLVAGDMSHNPEYKKEIDEKCKGLDVDFLGLIRDKDLLMSYLKHSIAFVFSSVNEAMSCMLLEAAATEAALICSDIPENYDVFEEGEALFFRAGDADDLAEKTAWALEHPQEMREFAASARHKLDTEFNWNVVAAQYDELYQKLLKS